MLVNDIVLRYGIPNIILTDQGTQFMSDLMRRLCKLLKITRTHTSIYHPESNGSLERSHKVIVEYLRCFCKDKQEAWDEWVAFAIFNYNTTPHTKLKYTPYELLFGKKANLPGTLQKPVKVTYCYDDYVINIKQKFRKTWEEARENLKDSKRKTVEVSQQKNKVNPVYRVGDYVTVRKEQRRKLDPLFVGPYEIKEIKGTNVTLVKVGTNGRKTIKTHVNRTQPYVLG